MTKEELLKNFTEDFKNVKGALSEVLEHNRQIDATLVQDLMEGDFAKLEEHTEISKLIMDGVKGFNELYKTIPSTLESIEKLSGDENGKGKVSLQDMMKELEENTIDEQAED